MVSNQRLEELASFYERFTDFTSPLAVELGVALRELLELRQREEWVKVSDGLPEITHLGEDKKYVMVCDAKERMSIAYHYSDHPQAWTMAKPIGVVTHWRLLPAPPKEGLATAIDPIQATESDAARKDK